VPRYRELPFLERLVGRALRAADPPVCGGRVSTDLPADAGEPARPWPVCTYERLGGAPAVKQKLDTGRIQVAVWGATQSEAHQQAEYARRVLHEMEGTVQDNGAAWVSAVEDETGLTRADDPVTGRDRYVFSVLVYASMYAPAA